MKLLALEKELQPVNSDQSRALLMDEAFRVWELQQSGCVRAIYFRADRHTAVLELECADVEEARQRISSLPLAVAGLSEFDILPLVPYDGFARLFADKSKG
jgi:hypothetical protein